MSETVAQSCSRYTCLFGVPYFHAVHGAMTDAECPGLPEIEKYHTLESFGVDSKNRDKKLRLPFTMGKNARVALSAIFTAYANELSHFFLAAEAEEAFGDDDENPLEQLAANCDIYCEDASFIPYLMKIAAAMREGALPLYDSAPLQYNSDAIDVFSGHLRDAFKAAAEADDTEMPAEAMADSIIRPCADNFVVFLKYLAMRATETSVYHHGTLNAGALVCAIAGLNLVAGLPPTEFVALPARVVAIEIKQKEVIAKKIEEIKAISASAAIAQACARGRKKPDSEPAKPAPKNKSSKKTPKAGKKAPKVHPEEIAA